MPRAFASVTDRYLSNRKSSRLLLLLVPVFIAVGFVAGWFVQKSIGQLPQTLATEDKSLVDLREANNLLERRLMSAQDELSVLKNRKELAQNRKEADHARQQAIEREEYLRQGRIEYGKALPAERMAAEIAIEQIKKGERIAPQQVAMLSNFRIFDDVLVPYLEKSALDGGFDSLLQITGIKDQNRIRSSKLVFGAFTDMEQAHLIRALSEVRGDRPVSPSELKSLEQINILKEILEKYYENQAIKAGKK